VRRILPSFLVDVAFVLVFALTGRISHTAGVTVPGLLQTAWPFLVGLAAGWAVVRLLLGAWPSEVTHAVPIWMLTVGLGMVLRVLSGGGAPLSFVVVASVVLGAFLLGWRSVAALTLFVGEGLQRWSGDLARKRTPPR
jgi:hypothetical protein